MSEKMMDDIFLQAMKQEEGSKQSENQGKFAVKVGKVVAVDATDIFLDMGGKAESVVPRSEFTKVPVLGEEVEVVMKEMKDGVNIASKLEADKVKKMQEIRNAFEEGMSVSGVLESVVKKDNQPKGFTVDLGLGNKAFLPLSQIDTRKSEKIEDMIGTSTDFAVIEVRKNNITVSRREYLNKTIKKLYNVFFEKHQIGDEVTGKVEKVEENYLVLVVEGIRAFMYVADFSWKYLSDLKKVVQIGDEMKVKVIQLDPAKNSVKVGKKQTMADPWVGMDKKYGMGDIVKGKVINYKKEGAIIEIEDGIEAFLSVDEMSWTEKVRDPKKFLKTGAIVESKIINLDTSRRRMDLSLREIQDNPWDRADEKYTYGKKCKGEITSIVDFGIFIKFDDGIEGLLRKEDVDWMDANVDLKKKYKKGDSIEVVVLALDKEREKLKLGIKQLSENPYKAFSMNYPKGSSVTAKVKSIDENGAIVELENDLEGFIHISQVSKDKVDGVEEALKVGEEITAMVKYVDVAKSKIELSRKDFLNNEEKREVEKYMAGTSGDNQTPTIGSLLKESFENLKVEKKDGKKKPKSEK